MKIIIDIEANGLLNPTKIWVIVCKDYDTGNVSVFRKVTEDEQERERFYSYWKQVRSCIGHNILGYDIPILNNLLGIVCNNYTTYDTFILSKLIDYARENGHSIEAYGEEFNLPKIDYKEGWSEYHESMVEYCIRDVDISEKIYNKYTKYINNPKHDKAIKLEHSFQEIVNKLRNNGFHFDVNKAKELLVEVSAKLDSLDKKIHRAFPPTLGLLREVHPTLTKFGTLSRKDFRFVKDGDLSEYNGGPFCRCSWQEFNPSSHKQIIEVLHEAGWKPVNKTKTHIQTERELNTYKYKRLDKDTILCYNTKLEKLKKYGYKIDEENLSTLPDSAPAPARTLAQRILIEARRRTLTEWLSLVRADGRIHGEFQGIGAWTQRMAHRNPNTANIPTGVKLYGDVMRSLWNVPEDKLLIGVDAESIQLRIFAHYINDQEFTDALVKGKKENKTDPHSLNQRILGDICNSRATAKRFIYALLLGAGRGKLQEILSCTPEQAEEALQRILKRYTGYAHLKETIIPRDARRGWFEGIDGRSVRIPGNSTSDRRHLCMSGYLQNGEAVIMKLACLKWHDELTKLGIPFKIVNFVHDEWQTEVPNNMDLAIEVAKIQADSLRIVGEELNLKCPLAGSYWNDDHHCYTIGRDWSTTH